MQASNKVSFNLETVGKDYAAFEGYVAWVFCYSKCQCQEQRFRLTYRCIVSFGTAILTLCKKAERQKVVPQVDRFSIDEILVVVWCL